MKMDRITTKVHTHTDTRTNTITKCFELIRTTNQILWAHTQRLGTSNDYVGNCVWVPATQMNVCEMELYTCTMLCRNIHRCISIRDIVTNSVALGRIGLCSLLWTLSLLGSQSHIRCCRRRVVSCHCFHCFVLFNFFFALLFILIIIITRLRSTWCNRSTL